MMEEAKKCIDERWRPGRENSSVYYGNHTRFNKAEEQMELKPVAVSKIIKHTNDFLELLGMDKVNDARQENKTWGKKLYKEIKDNNDLEDERDIVWMKFTKDAFLSVVATSSDVNFDVPVSDKDYNKKHNTSGIIIHYLNTEWDESFVLVFPLKKIPQGLKRGDIERGIGNYLIKQGVPILDFYSHRY